MTDEAKRCVEALRNCHSNDDCRDCKFVDSDKDEMSCVNVLFVSAADLIEFLSAELEQVKAERDGLNVMLGQAQSMLETRTRERDAAVKDLEFFAACQFCKHYEEDTCTGECTVPGAKTHWQWRGVKEDDNG